VDSLIRLVLDKAERVFQEEVDEFASAWMDRADTLQYYRGRGGVAREVYAGLGDRGWLSLTWPKTVGGLGLPPIYDFLLWDTLAHRRLVRPDLGPGIVAQGIIRQGSREQQQRWLPGLSSGRLAVSLGYSEPEAGSDLAGVLTRADRDGDMYIVRGEKCWTSDAQHADLLWTLCRTGERQDHSRGLTVLVIDMKSDGISVVPIPTIDGHQLNQVYLDDVRVPVADRVGSEGEAWALIREVLAVERHLQLLPGRIRRDIEELDERLRGSSATVDPRAAQIVEDLWARLRQVEASALATITELTAGKSATLSAARTRLLGGLLAQAVPRSALELIGAEACVDDDPFSFLWKQSYMETIAGGSSEMMLNILTKQALHLGSPR
jgi:alkylation response protein AidB-like acyl-CoA dehydrogenase